MGVVVIINTNNGLFGEKEREGEMERGNEAFYPFLSGIWSAILLFENTFSRLRSAQQVTSIYCNCFLIFPPIVTYF